MKSQNATPLPTSPAGQNSWLAPRPPGPYRGGMPPGQVSRRAFLRFGLGTLASSPLLLGCQSITGGDDSDPVVRFEARPGIPNLTPETGLTQLGLGGKRDGILYVPESYSPDTPAPLFVAMHGAGGTGSFWGSYHALAEEKGMVLLAPDSRSSQSWDLMVGNSVGKDVRFLDKALKHTFERCRIDPARVALGGFSDGASYTLSLGPSNGDLFTHLVAFSPGFFQIFEPVVGKPSVFVSHGTEDPVISVFHVRRNLLPALEDSGYDVTYEEFNGGHGVPSAITGKALSWFLEPS